MPSSEKVVSPGVFTNEIDQTFLPAAVGDIGAALIGPTVKGPAGIPTVVTNYAEYQQTFGDTFKSGSGYYSYLTSYTAREYLKHGASLTVVRILDGAYSTAEANIPTGSIGPSGTQYNTGSSTATDWDAADQNSFKLHTISHGSILNGARPGTGGYEGNDLTTSNLNKSGSANNLRWEISTVNPKKGTFTLLIRRGNDTHKRKQTLETWNNVSLDPREPNYIAKIIGDQSLTLKDSGTTEPYLQLSGSHPNKSKYVRVEVLKDTAGYLDANGNITTNAAGHAVITGSLPGINSGSFTGGSDGWIGFDSLGTQQGDDSAVNFYEKITDDNSQGYDLSGGSSSNTGRGFSAYQDAINLLGNQDEYDINLVLMPGLIDNGSGCGQLITKAIDMCENRSDAFVIADPTFYDAAITTATSEAEGRDSSYSAMYYPWVQIADPDLNKSVWVPPSVVMGGIFAFNDKVAHPWFAPAGLNRGGIDVAVQVERKLTHSNRDTLYESNVNPIATFPGQGICVWGQKTLQKKSSALDRVNVRRLMIRVKKFIASSSRFLVFEQNNASTRKRFLAIVNPYLEQVQSNSGLNAFRVVMDETNNTPDLVDRNILYGQIFLQPTRTAEFIVLDFTIQPTGATFPE
tara:strand:+ start:1434 stop:3323 length:1890 start_codon:yes stop_codon:yes gene_type:complete